jgi:hypothetical protein
MKISKIEYNKPYELEKGLNLLINTDIVTLESFSENLLEDYIDEETDFYIGFYTNPDDLKIYNKLYYQGLISQNPEINKKAYDLLPIIIFNNKENLNQFPLDSFSDNKFYFWNKYFESNKDKKIKFIYKNIGTIKIDWESQLEDRKKELETGI